MRSIVFAVLICFSYVLFASTDSSCEKTLIAGTHIQVEHEDQFLRRYGPPPVLDRFVEAEKIKKVLDRLHVAYREVNYEIVVKPISKPGLNQLAYELDRSSNIVLALNKHSYSDRLAPSPDPYFQATSDAQSVYLVLSLDFLKDVASSPEGFDVGQWVHNAETYLAGYDLLRPELQGTHLVLGDGQDIDVEHLVTSHRQEMARQIYLVNHASNPAAVDLAPARAVQAKFADTIRDLEGRLLRVIEDLGLRSRYSLMSPQALNPFRDRTLIKKMEVQLVEAGNGRYRVLMTLPAGDGRLNFYLRDEMSFSRPLRTLHNPQRVFWQLTRDEKRELADRAAFQIETLFRTIWGLRIQMDHAELDSRLNLRRYNINLLKSSSRDNVGFIY